MKARSREQYRADQVSDLVDRLTRDPDARIGQLDGGDDALLSTVQELARLPALLGPVDPVLEQRVMRLSQSHASSRRAKSLRYLRPGWVIAGVAAAVLLVALLTPFGQTAVASFMAVFNLGSTQVRITPVDVPSALEATDEMRAAVVRESLTLEEAAEQASFPILQPAYLPPGYQLLEAVGHTYPDLPAWVPRPFSMELVYEDDQGAWFSLHMYPISLGSDTRARVSGVNLEAAPIQDVRDVDVNGQPGMLLLLASGGDETGLKELVWEQGHVVLALSAVDLTEAELLRIARSARE
jgi:hypothetical protein